MIIKISLDWSVMCVSAVRTESSITGIFAHRLHYIRAYLHCIHMYKATCAAYASQENVVWHVLTCWRTRRCTYIALFFSISAAGGMEISEKIRQTYHSISPTIKSVRYCNLNISNQCTSGDFYLSWR